MGPHLVCFAPYTNWSIHAAREVTILQGLRLRGCTVTYVACDAVYTACDMTQTANGATQGPGPTACLTCQSSVSARLAAWGMPYRWFGRWLKPEDATTAATWVAHCRPETFPTARYTAAADGRPDGESWDVGAWVSSSVHTHLRRTTLDVRDPEVAEAYRTYLTGGLLTAFGLSRLFARERPQAQLLFNGRMFSPRIALEIARQRGIRTLVEERAVAEGRMTLFEGGHCLDLHVFQNLWRQWRDVPLDPDQIAAVAALMAERWQGRSRDVSAFSRRGENREAIFRRLRLDPNRPVWVLFTSTLDESVDEVRIDNVFPNQPAWLAAAVAEARRRPDVQLIVRAHPNSGSRLSLGSNGEERAMVAALAEDLPENVRLIPSDDETSSYTLAAAADLGLAWYSTIGLEMASAGKPVVRAGGSWITHCPAFVAPRDPSDFGAAIDRALAEDATMRAERTVAAWRFAYCWYFRHTLAFPLVRQSTWFAGEPAYTTFDALAPGRDAALDHVCNVLMAGAPLHPGPGNTHPGDPEDELRRVIAAAGALRDSTA